MMRKRTHRWIFVLLIFALMFLTACTPQEPSESPPESGSAAESQDAESWIQSEPEVEMHPLYDVAPWMFPSLDEFEAAMAGDKSAGHADWTSDEIIESTQLWEWPGYYYPKSPPEGYRLAMIYVGPWKYVLFRFVPESQTDYRDNYIDFEYSYEDREIDPQTFAENYLGKTYSTSQPGENMYFSETYRALRHLMDAQKGVFVTIREMLGEGPMTAKELAGLCSHEWRAANRD